MTPAAGIGRPGDVDDEHYLDLPNARVTCWSTKRYQNLTDQFNESGYTQMPNMVPKPHVGVRTASQIEQKVSLESVVYWQETYRPMYLEVVRVMPGVSQEEFKAALFTLMKNLASQYGTAAYKDDPSNTAAVKDTKFGALGLARDLCTDWRDKLTKVRAWVQAIEKHFKARGVPNTFWRPDHLARPKNIAEVRYLLDQYQNSQSPAMVNILELDKFRQMDPETGNFVSLDLWHRPVPSEVPAAAPAVSPWAHWGDASSSWSTPVCA